MRRMVTTSGLARTGDLETLSGLLEYEALPGSNSPDQADTKAREDYQRILGEIRTQLKRKFSRPDDPQLYWRRRKLHELFDSVPFAFVKELLSRLENSADPLGLLLISRVAPVTRREMLGVLHTKLTLTPPEPDLRRDVLNLLTRGAPLPGTLEPEFEKAASRIDSILQQSLFQGTRDLDQVTLLLCVLQKLRASRPDDRVIFWGDRCPMNDLKRTKRPFCVQLIPPMGESLLRHGTWVRDRNPRELLSDFTNHLKPILLNIHLANPNDDEEESIFRSLVSILSEINLALERLNIVFGYPDWDHFHDGLFHMKEQINKQTADPRSIYHCLGIRIRP